jgi:hypothetical protein
MSMQAALTPLTLTLDPAQVRAAGARWLGRNRYGLTLRPAQLIVGVLYVALGIGGLVFARRASLTNPATITSIVFIVLGAVSALQGIGRLDFQPRPLPVATLHLDDTALTTTDGRGVRRVFDWHVVKAVQRTPDALVFVLTWRRAIVVPAAAIAERQTELWSQLYAHLVSRRGLYPTPADRSTEIVNTAR